MTTDAKTGPNARIFNIAPGLPFLEVLAQSLIDGELIPDFNPHFNPLDDQFGFGDAIIYLPTRRAARGFSAILQRMVAARTGCQALFLPKIRTIGDIDEEETLFGLEPEIARQLFWDDGQMLGQVIGNGERLVALARLVQGWTSAMLPKTRALFDGEPIILPASPADAIGMAGHLCRFMDQLETEEADWSRIARFLGDDHQLQQWWQVSLTFLDIVMKSWPEILKQTGKINPAQYRRRVIDLRCRQLTQNPPKGPVIAAGSTGSIPATARLMQVIAGLKKGAIVLPGLDRDLPERCYKRFFVADELESETALSTHAQFGLSRLAQQLVKNIDLICELGKPDRPLLLRKSAINSALLPADQSNLWAERRAQINDSDLHTAFENVSLVEAATEREEALALALILRQTLEDETKNAALVTPERNLARRVSAELQRFGIIVDDSAGQPLKTSAAALFARLVLKIASANFDAADLAGLLRQEALLAGNQTKTAKHLRALFELVAAREVAVPPKIGEFQIAITIYRQKQEKLRYAPVAIGQMKQNDWQELEDFAGRLDAGFLPLQQLFDGQSELAESGVSVGQLLEALFAAIACLAGDETGKNRAETLPGFDALAALAGQFSEDFEHGENEIASLQSGFVLGQRDCVSVFDALIANTPFFPTSQAHPRLQILGPLEARLQASDLVIIAGLNEGVWPGPAKNDPFLNRPMKSALQLPLPERRIGLAAHDFCQLSGAPSVIYSRSLRHDNAPSIASRWLQRLAAFVGEDVAASIKKRGQAHIDLARRLDRQKPEQALSMRPCPKPPVKIRPRRLSVTEIGTWICDPYAIYARHVLGLKPLPQLNKGLKMENEAALRGQLYHEIFADFIEATQTQAQSGKPEQLLDEIARNHFSASSFTDEIMAQLKPRFETIAVDFLAWHSEQKALIEKSHVEINGRLYLEAEDFTLTGRADRIDRLKDGSYNIVDYKTGKNPTAAQARSVVPQLPLEAMMLKRGAFENIEPAISPPKIEDLLYVRLRSGDFKIDSITIKKGKNAVSAEELGENVFKQLQGLIKAYHRPEQGYVSHHLVLSGANFSGDYDHLARSGEWSLGQAGVDDEHEGGEYD